MVNGDRLSIDEDSTDPTNSSCFNRKDTNKKVVLTIVIDQYLWIYLALPLSFEYDNNTIRSSLIIMSRSLQVNQIYEFYVVMYDDEVLVDKSDPMLIQIQSQDSFIIEIS